LSSAILYLAIVAIFYALAHFVGRAHARAHHHKAKLAA